MSFLSRKKQTVSDPSHHPRIKILQGPHKGTSYRLTAGKVMIGRSEESSIVLNKDKKCSRRQALIIFKQGAFHIKDLSGKGSLKVNGLRKVQTALKNGDQVQCGVSVLEFEYKAPVVSSSRTPALRPAGAPIPFPVSGNAPPVPAGGLSFPQHPPGQAGPADLKPNKKSKRPKIILAGIGLLALYLFLSDTEKKPVDKKEDSLRTTQDREEKIQTLQELKTAEEEKRKKNLDVSFKNAQRAYIKGVRDYRKGVYIRAIESFKVCQTLYPQHELCSSYLQKARMKKEQLVQAWMMDGAKARDNKRFSACMAAFKNVMLAVRNQNDLSYKEALENYNICKIQFEDRY